MGKNEWTDEMIEEAYSSFFEDGRKTTPNGEKIMDAISSTNMNVEQFIKVACNFYKYCRLFNISYNADHLLSEKMRRAILSTCVEINEKERLVLSVIAKFVSTYILQRT